MGAGLGVFMGVSPGGSAIAMAAYDCDALLTARRGLVLGSLSAATATGQLLFAPPEAWIAETHSRAQLLSFLLRNGVPDLANTL